MYFSFSNGVGLGEVWGGVEVGKGGVLHHCKLTLAMVLQWFEWLRLKYYSITAFFKIVSIAAIVLTILIGYKALKVCYNKRTKDL